MVQIMPNIGADNALIWCIISKILSPPDENYTILHHFSAYPNVSKYSSKIEQNVLTY